MNFNSIMHISFYTNQFDKMVDFYKNVLRAKQKVIVRYSEYLDRPDRKNLYEMALSHPNDIFYTYLELAPGQFIELFPATADQKPHGEWNDSADYSHFALTVDDIEEASKTLQERGLQPDTPISCGPSHTYQQWFHDPDGNKFELMQFTDQSWQLTGHQTEMIEQ